MISVYVPCPFCVGQCHVWHSDELGYQRCSHCDGIGRAWDVGAPGYGCRETLADRECGEVVTLGNGQRAKILWHQPRKTKKVRPTTTFVDLLEEFTDAETFAPIAYPSSVGVSEVDARRDVRDRDDHNGERAADYNDPMQRSEGMMI